MLAFWSAATCRRFGTANLTNGLLYWQPASPSRTETVSRLGLLSIFVRVTSCDFVDRFFRGIKTEDPPSREEARS